MFTERHESFSRTLHADGVYTPQPVVDGTRMARAIEATGRKKLIFVGISLEVCAAFPAMTAVGMGLDACCRQASSALAQAYNL